STAELSAQKERADHSMRSGQRKEECFGLPSLPDAFLCGPQGLFRKGAGLAAALRGETEISVDLEQRLMVPKPAGITRGPFPASEQPEPGDLCLRSFLRGGQLCIRGPQVRALRNKKRIDHIGENVAN